MAFGRIEGASTAVHLTRHLHRRHPVQTIAAIAAAITVPTLATGVLLLAVAAPAAAATPAPALHVAGNQLVDASGTPTRLIGVDRSGTEYACV